jgi:HEPN domain-containing protein
VKESCCGKKSRKLLTLWKTKAVNKELTSADPVTDIVCFHCQQAAEKYLKLYLISKGIEPKKTHLIGDLLKTCLDFDKSFELLQSTLFLSEYAVEIRYPDEYYVPTVAECKKALAAAMQVKELVMRVVIFN